MRRLIPMVVLAAASAAFAGLTFTPGGLRGGLEWEPVEGDYQYLVIMGSPEEYDADDPAWGVEFGSVYPDEETGTFPTSYVISPAFIILPDRCIADQLCLRQCPVNAIDLDTEGKAIIEPGLCISCGLCAVVCPTDAIFAPSSSTYWVLFGADADGELVPLQELGE